MVRIINLILALAQTGQRFHFHSPLNDAIKETLVYSDSLSATCGGSAYSHALQCPGYESYPVCVYIQEIIIYTERL